MKEKQNKRWGLKLLSFVCAFIVWLGVVNVADPVMSDSVEVPVEIVNGDILADSGLTYEISGKKTTTITYDVKTTNAYRIRSSDFRAYADVTELWSVTGSVPVKVEILNNSEYLLSTPVSKMSTIKIETEPLQRKRFSLNTTFLGEVEDGYMAGDIKLAPDHVYVEGPESLIGQISSAGIEVSLEGLSNDTSGVAMPYYYDANGNRITLSDRIETNCESVDYELQVLKVKELPLNFEVSGTVADGYRFTGVECDVKNISVVGLKSVLASLNTLTVPAESLNVDDAKTDIVKTIDLEDLLPAGVSLVGTGRHEINVTMTVERLEDRVYTVDVNYDCFVGESDEYIYRADPSTVTVRVRALREELDSLTIESSDLSVDVSEMTEGFYNTTVEFRNELDPAYEIVYITSCNINVMKVLEGPGATEASTEETTESEESPVSGTVAETTEARITN